MEGTRSNEMVPQKGEAQHQYQLQASKFCSPNQHQGNDIYDEKPVVFDAYKLFRKPSELEDMTFTINVFTNHEQRAPTRQQTGTVQLLAHITVRVDEPFDQLPKFTNSEGTVFREVEHDIEMTTDGTSMDWKVLVNGEVSGRQNITIERGIDSWG